MTDQSGAFLYTLREAAQRVVEQCFGMDRSIDKLGAVLDDFAAVGRPRPAPPEPSREAIYAVLRAQGQQAIDSYQHSTIIDNTRRDLRAAYAVDLGRSAGTGAWSETMLREEAGRIAQGLMRYEPERGWVLNPSESPAGVALRIMDFVREAAGTGAAPRTRYGRWLGAYAAPPITTCRISPALRERSSG